MRNIKGHRAIIFLILFSLTCLTIWLGVDMHRNALLDRKLKADYFTVNQIKYGLLSGSNWTSQVNRIIAAKIDSFSFEGENKKVMEHQINDLLARLFDEADRVLHKEREGLREKIKYSLINSFIDVDDYRPEIPRFSKAIVDELAKSRHKEKLKTLIKNKVSGLLDAQNQDTTGEKAQVVRKYGYQSLEKFNDFVRIYTEQLRQDQRLKAYFILGVMAALLLIWIVIFRIKRYFALTFLFSVLISFIALFIGVSLPMIEIDARISELNLSILSGHIVFYDQVIFYQAKSILDVIRILIVHGRGDTVFVGFLILLFSVLFPVTKLICTTIYLFVKERSNRFVRFMAFNSGKWSMADVMVIAIFMAYVGFQSILDNQLEDITTHTSTINVVTTNRTSLQTGFLVFVGFTLFTLILADILKRITRYKEQAKTTSHN